MRLKLVICLVFSLVLAPTLYAAEMHSFVMDTGAYVANNGLNRYGYTNSTDRIWYIWTINIWLGADKGMETDIFAAIYRMSDGEELSSIGWDRYAPPDGLHTWPEKYSPHWYTLMPGDSLILFTACNGSNGHCHARATVYYTLSIK